MASVFNGGMAEKDASLLAHFGAELRLYRQQAGLTQEQLGDRLGYSNGLVSQVEHARRMPSRELAATADEVLRTGGVLSRVWPLVDALSTRHKGFRAYLDHESCATVIHSYDSHLVPGLLQTEDYARHLLEAERPSVPPAEVEARLAVRMTRQEILRRASPCPLWAVVDESVLHRQVGSARVLRDQLDHVLACAALPNVTVQVYPFETGADPAYGQAFVIAELPGGHAACHIDAPAGAGPYPDEESATRYRLIFDHLRASALPENRSATLIVARVEELTNHE